MEITRFLIRDVYYQSVNFRFWLRGFNMHSHQQLEILKEDDIDYEKAIQKLNTLQSNQATLQQSYLTKSQTNQDTLNCLIRTDVSLDDLDKISFIHVSGSKGKGSTCALTESILRAYGKRTGFFSSPHLVSVTERIRINGKPISQSIFTKFFWRVYNKLEKTQTHSKDMPAYFKFLTILSFHIFMHEQVDVVLLEVGIGGELDCTNVIRNTETVGITSLGLEHTKLLGNTLEDIAWQKAGIIKPNSNVFTNVTQEVCLNVINQRAAKRNAKVYQVPNLQSYFGNTEKKKEILLFNNVIRLNGSLAIQLALNWLRNHSENNNQYFNVNEFNTIVLECFRNFIWPGRFQIFQMHNLKIHLDGAHTMESMNVCSDWFYEVTSKENISYSPKVLVFNTTGDRDSKNLMKLLRSKHQFDAVYFVPNIASSSIRKEDQQTNIAYSQHEERILMQADQWNSLCNNNQEKKSCFVFKSVVDAFQHIRHTYRDQPEVNVLVTGSLHLIGATVVALSELSLKNPTNCVN